MDLVWFFFIAACYQRFAFTEQTCHSNHVEYDEYKGSCYYFSPSELDFDTANSSCESLGMHLVYIGSQDEQDFLMQHLILHNYITQQYWIGLSTLTWFDGSSLIYENFGPSFLAFDDGGLCFWMKGDFFRWNDGNCSFLFYYICESQGPCDENHTEHSGSCYHFSQSKSNFSSSKSSCENLGMDLVSIGSGDEQNFLEVNVQNRIVGHWIGLSSITWRDGSSLTYNKIDDDSAAFDEKGICFRMTAPPNCKWRDQRCHVSNHYICEAENDTSGFMSFATTGQVQTEKSSVATVQPTGAISATQTASYTTSPSRVPTRTSGTLPSCEGAQRRSSNFILVAENATLIDVDVHSSFTTSSTIRCAQRCFADVFCTCFTYIAQQRACLLGGACQYGSNRETLYGAKTYTFVY